MGPGLAASIRGEYPKVWTEGAEAAAGTKRRRVATSPLTAMAEGAAPVRYAGGRGRE